jgi:lipopolysaccharide/colanic/teichoic acid biosynthesis glycosyltransferase
MSLVGPAARRPDDAADLEWEIPFFDRRELAKPGITGWAQVRCETDAGATPVQSGALAVCHDLYYLKHRSTPLDLVILLQASFTGSRDLVPVSVADQAADDARHSLAGA